MHLGLLALLDGLGVLAVWLICNAAIGAWFTGATGQDKLAAAILDGIFYWRLYVLLFLHRAAARRCRRPGSATSPTTMHAPCTPVSRW